MNRGAYDTQLGRADKDLKISRTACFLFFFDVLPSIRKPNRREVGKGMISVVEERGDTGPGNCHGRGRVSGSPGKSAPSCLPETAVDPGPRPGGIPLA